MSYAYSGIPLIRTPWGLSTLLRCLDFRGQYFSTICECKPTAHVRWLWLTLDLTYNTWSWLYLCCRDCSVLYGLKDTISHCFNLVHVLVKYFFVTFASKVSSVSPSILETGLPLAALLATPENHSVYICTALLHALVVLYGFYTGCGTNTLLSLL